MALGTISRIFREVKGQNSYQSEYYVVRQPSHRRRSRARSVERTSLSESRPRKEHHVHEVEIHRKPSRRHGDREKKVRKEYEYRYELFQDDSEAEDNDDLKHVSWAQWPDLHTQLSDHQARQSATEPSFQFQPQTYNPDLHQWISAELALLWSSIDQLHHQHKERSANYDPCLQQAILASYATFKQEQIQPLLDEIARLERQGKDYEELVKELFGVIKGYQVELRSVWDREEREKKEKEEKADRAKRERGRRHDEEATPRRREWETWRDFSGPTLAGVASGSNPSSPTGSAPPPYDDGQLPPAEIPAPAPAPQTVPIPTVPARPPKELEHPHQPRVRFEEYLHEIPAPRHYTDDEYEYGPRDHRRRERGRTREHEYTYDRPRSSSKETHIHRDRDWQHPHDVRHGQGHRPLDRDHQNDRHHRRHHHDERSERRFDDRLTDWNIPSPNIPAPSTHWDLHPRSPRSARDFDAYEPKTRSEPCTRRRHSVSYSPPSQVVDREGDKYPRGWRVVRFAV
ncbi:hypothetical protein NEUTE1DRAFT_113323 [Neurospora tetrasperma FGSC 2508]|uniref:Uncharacterized protein n=1 Tax=Neurospora tetrasperma (strain FGSC 2508 / ATCC MYA-4615 / P0657) TaxID=510951 RepID=F8MWA0_NEUT8|nr:uncharacterized protein NEUTE1DRAFT_113323 [Neurospora tetrasperma FGSC 2508]EGO54895.1 hypothetical protein NEUTE1DRAFT_113323 [Neurospora tetrasperma FGSC 2508]EGZ67612.1 hypothetical protein NEUTE2DRAFT_141411 [Neurospora tetrasperma FGSC 2509]